MSKVGEYSILPIAIPSTPAYPEPTTHTIYLRPHTPRIPTENDSRSLFLVNVPIDSTSAHLRAVFTSLVGTGRFESVRFENDKKTTAPSTTLATIGVEAGAGASKKRKRGDEAGAGTGGDGLPKIWDRELRRSGSTAVVLFVDEKSVELVLKATRRLVKKGEGCAWGENVLVSSSGKPSQDKTSVPALGSARYAAHQRLRYPSKAVLQAHVDSFMTSFNALEKSRAQANKRARGVPDEDGFVTIVRGGRTGPARMEEAQRKREEQEKRESEKRGAMGDFYRFQMRERRKDEAGELVRRFEEDRRRVEGMREGRGRKGFRPEN